MYRNQYLITSSPDRHTCLHAAKQMRFGEWNVYLFHPLQAYHVTHDGMEAMLIGLVVDPLAPGLSMQGVLDEVARGPDLTPELISERIEALTGRFVLAVRFADGKTFIWGDACHLRQILYARFDNVICVGSSEKLMLEHVGAKLTMSQAKQSFRATTRFSKNEHAWVGRNGQDDRVTRLLPNHRLSVPDLKYERVDFYYQLPAGQGEEAVLELARATLVGLFKALCPQYSILVALTAGWDTRLLMAASLPWKDSIGYFTFVRPGDKSSAGDGDVAQLLANQFKLNYERIQPAPVTSEFEAAIAKEQLFPRVLPKTANIQHHLKRPHRDRIINVNGNGAEVARCIYGTPGGPHSLSRICRYLGFSPNNPFVRASMEPWLEEANQIAKNTNIRVNDLAHWELRMGIWGAATPFEQDIAIEEISPFNNKRLLLALLTIPERERAAPEYPLYGRLLRSLNEEAAQIAINSHLPWYKFHVDGSATATFLSRRLKHIFADRSLR